jgi:hypothetical protein
VQQERNPKPTEMTQGKSNSVPTPPFSLSISASSTPCWFCICRSYDHCGAIGGGSAGGTGTAGGTGSPGGMGSAGGTGSAVGVGSGCGDVVGAVSCAHAAGQEMAIRRDTAHGRLGPSPDENDRSGMLDAAGVRASARTRQSSGRVACGAPGLIVQTRPKWSTHCTFVRSMLRCAPRTHDRQSDGRFTGGG